MHQHDKVLNSILSNLDKKSECAANYFKPLPPITPSRKEVILIIKNIQSLMFPEYFHLSENEGKSREEILDSVFFALKRQITASYAFGSKEAAKDTETLAYEILSLIPGIKEKLIKDVQAIYEGDPAARSPEEVILSYPGFYAISIYRLAHEFYVRDIPFISAFIAI